MLLLLGGLQQFLCKSLSQTLRAEISPMLVLAPVRDHVLVYFAPMQRGSKYSGIKTITKHESACKAFPHSPLASEWLIYKPAVKTERLLTSFYRKAKKYFKKILAVQNTMKNCFLPTWQSAVCVYWWPVKERSLFIFHMSTQELGPTKQITSFKVSLRAKQWPAHPSWIPASPLTICSLCQHRAGSHRLHAP